MCKYVRTFVLFFLALAVSPHWSVQAADQSPKAVALEMVDAWNTLDLDRMIDMFAEDGVLHSVMVDPIVGREDLRAHLAPLLVGVTKLELKLKNVVVSGNTVFLERVDEFDINGSHGAVPVVGVMEIENGKVKEWREYYDRATLLSEMGIAPAAQDGGH
ncbi:MAG: nuclear transport factor 2 family protein [Rhodobacteraceae bacterium]|nr:nuclear transport factor 2 family protein [Paracoccaceae bacterium]